MTAGHGSDGDRRRRDRDATTRGCSFVLPRLLDLPSAGALQQDLTAALNQGGDLVIDGHDVERVSTAALQVLVAAKACVDASGGAMTIERASPALSAAIADLGLNSIFNKGAKATWESEF